MKKHLSLSQANLDLLLSHAEHELPLESVSLLFGTETEYEHNVNRVIPMENTLKSRTRFKIDPEQLYALLLEAEKENEELVGIFHSHPAPPYPSPSDIANMRLNPVVWVIASNLTGMWTYRGYILKKEKVCEVELVVL